METPSPLAVVTGASGGIGYELARLLARDRYRLVLVARSEDKLEAFARELRTQYGAPAEVVALDLSDPEAPATLHARLEALRAPVEILVNNAGFGTYGPFVETDLDKTLEMLRLNVVALAELTRRFLPDMVRRGRGCVLNVASTAAFQPGPLMAGYYASKAFVLSFSEALAEELRDTGVTVTTLCPGPTETGFQQRAEMEHSKLFSRMEPMSAERVAREGYHGMMKGKRVVIPGLRNRIGAFGTRLVSRRFAARVARRVQESRH